MILRAAPCLLLLALAACPASLDPMGREIGKEAPEPDLEMMRQYSRNLQQYVDAIAALREHAGAGLGGREAAVRAAPAARRLRGRSPADQGLPRGRRSGPQGAGPPRRAAPVHAGLREGDLHRAKWEEARKALMDAGEPGQVLLATTLLKLLLNGQYQELRPHRGSRWSSPAPSRSRRRPAWPASWPRTPRRPRRSSTWTTWSRS